MCVGSDTKMRNTKVDVSEALSSECICSVLVYVLEAKAGKLWLVKESRLKIKADMFLHN